MEDEEEKVRDGSDFAAVRAAWALMRVFALSTVCERTKGEQEQSRIGSKARVTG